MGSKKKADKKKIDKEQTTRTGKLIRERREKLDLSQRDLAKSLGFTSVFLSRIEFGKCALPTKYVDRVSKLLDIPKDDILFTIKHDMNSRLDKKFSH